MYNIFDTSYGTHVVSSFYDIYDSTWKNRSAFKNIQTSINNLVTKGCLHCFYLAFVSGGNFCVHIFCLLGQTNTLRLPPIFLALKIFIIYHWVYKSRKTFIVTLILDNSKIVFLNISCWTLFYWCLRLQKHFQEKLFLSKT